MNDITLTDLDVDVGDIVLLEKLSALMGHDDTIIPGERSRHHTEPEDDGASANSGVSDANDVAGVTLHLLRNQEG
jgi:hypothetical protein